MTAYGSGAYGAGAYGGDSTSAATDSGGAIAAILAVLHFWRFLIA